MLDDSSQSSFKPYHQGSGSLTPLPFHDSAHTMYEPYQMQSSEHLSGNGSGRDLNQTGNGMYTQNVVTGFNPNMQHNLYSTNLTAPTTTSNRIPDPNMFKINAQYTQNFPNTSIFLENRDILDDKEYPKLYHRHSTIIDDHSDNGDHGQDINRRYSDTKLLQTHNSDEDSLNSNGNENEHVIQPIFNVANVLGTAIPSTYTAHQNIVPQITDIIFENTSPGGTFDPLNINEQNPGHDRQYNIYPRHSMHNVALRETRHVAADNRNVFKSMPNLSGSSENLLQMQWTRFAFASTNKNQNDQQISMEIYTAMTQNNSNHNNKKTENIKNKWKTKSLPKTEKIKTKKPLLFDMKHVIWT